MTSPRSDWALKRQEELIEDVGRREGSQVDSAASLRIEATRGDVEVGMRRTDEAGGCSLPRGSFEMKKAGFVCEEPKEGRPSVKFE